jgi:bacterioferritin
MVVQEFIQLLNDDLTLEYAAAIQYKQHAAMVKGEFFAFTKELLEHADEELNHAEKIKNLITWLGGTPSARIAPTYMSNDNLAMMQQDLDGEETAITRYQNRIEQALNDNFYIAVHTLQKILTDEASHRQDIKSIMGRS